MAFGAAPLSNFSDAGGKPIEGHADSVDLNGATFRRTENDLMFSPTREAVIAVPNNELEDVFTAVGGGARKSGPPLARFAFNLNAFREVNPDRFKSFMDGIRGSNPPKDEAGRYGQELVFNFMEELGRVDFAMGVAGADITLKLALAPAHVPAAGSFPKPGMPTDVVARVDVGASPAKLISSLDDLLKRAAENIPLAKGKPGTPVQQKQLLQMLQAVSHLFLDGQAISVGVAPQGNGVVVYIVQQKPQANLASRLRSVADEFNKTSVLVDEADDKSSVVIEHYTTPDGLSVTRAKIIEKGEPQGCLDAAEKDGAVYMALFAGEEKHIESLVALKSKGHISSLVHLEVDLERALAAAEKSGNGKLSKLTDDQRKILADVVAGRTLNFNATGEGDSIVFSTTLPKPFVAKAVGLLQQSAGKGQDPAP